MALRRKAATAAPEELTKKNNVELCFVLDIEKLVYELN
jgi:hypothetical protein